MKVLAIGFSKTGTKTMDSALRQLGYKVYDYDKNFYYLRKQWIKICTMGGTKEDFYEMYKDVDACTDIPANIFWKEILEAFPDTKLVFTYRENEQEWLKSFQNTTRHINSNYFMMILGVLSPTARSMYQYSHHMSRIALSGPPEPFYCMFSGISPNLALIAHRKHDADVMQNAPKGQMLKFSVKEGWGPLCKFLGKPIPDVPFPHKNVQGTVLDEYLRESPVFQRMKKEMMVVVSVLVLLAAVAFFYFFV